MRLPEPEFSGIVHLSSPVTAVGPFPICTGFPFKQPQGLNTVVVEIA